MSSDTSARAGQPADRPRRADRISVVGTAIGLCLIVGALILFNAFPNKIGYYETLGDETTFRPLLSPEFQRHMPVINAWFGLAFSLGLAHLALRRWTLVTRAADVGLTLFGCYIWLELIKGGPILAHDPHWIVLNAPFQELGRGWFPGEWVGFTALLGIALVITAFSALVKLIQLMAAIARSS